MTVLVIINRTKDSDCQAECYILGILYDWDSGNYPSPKL